MKSEELSATISLFEAAVKCYKLFSEALFARKHERNLYYKFRIEEARFVLWGRSWGYSLESAESQLDDQFNGDPRFARTTRGILGRIIDTLTNAEKRFQLATESPGLDLNSYRSSPEAEPESSVRSFINYRRLTPEVNNDGFRRSLSLVMDQRWPNSDKSTFTAFIKDIKDLNDQIYALVPRTTQVSLSRALPAEILSHTEDQIEICTIADVASQEYPRIQQTANLKRVAVERISAWTAENINLVKTFEIEESYIEFRKSGSPLRPLRDKKVINYSARMHAEYFPPESPRSEFGINVLIEWRCYDTAENMRLEMFSRVDNLARLLHTSPRTAETRTLEFIGWFRFNSTDRIGFVYKNPFLPLGDRPVPHCSLHTLMAGLPIPSIRDRFNMAKAVARAVLQLHSAGWLHRDIRSKNIIFFPTHAEYLEGDQGFEAKSWEFDQPYIMGFVYTEGWDPKRPDPRMSYDYPGYAPNTVNIQNLRLKHVSGPPGSANTAVLLPFGRANDIFSLGCLLLEMGLWTSLDLFQQSGTDWDEKVKEHVNKLAASCGPTYQSIVEWCLTRKREGEPENWEGLGAFVWEGMNKPENMEELGAFVWEVLDKLENLRV